LNYVRLDKDPTVRQWLSRNALFGQRRSSRRTVHFIHGRSRQRVRDRAGCNISDGGIFTRKQRMAMVPKLIDLQ